MTYTRPQLTTSIHNYIELIKLHLACILVCLGSSVLQLQHACSCSTWSAAGLFACSTLPAGSAHCARRVRCTEQRPRCCACASMGVLLQALPQASVDCSYCQLSERSIVLADYEVDFINFFTRLTGTKMGAKFDDDAYLVPIKIDVPRL